LEKKEKMGKKGGFKRKKRSGGIQAKKKNTPLGTRKLIKNWGRTRQPEEKYEQ